MKAFAFFSMLACIVLLAGCSGARESAAPSVYRGGQYYGDAVHAQDLKQR